MPFFWYNTADMVKNIAAALRRLLPFGVSPARILPLTIAAIVLLCTAAFAKNSDITAAAKSQIHRQTQFAVHNNWQMAADNRQTQFEFEQTQFAVRNDWQQTAHNRQIQFEQTQFKQFDFDALPLQNAPQVVPQNVVVAQATPETNISSVGGGIDTASGVVTTDGRFILDTSGGKYLSVVVYGNEDTALFSDAVAIGAAGGSVSSSGGHLSYDRTTENSNVVISNMRFALSAYLLTAANNYAKPFIRFAVLQDSGGSPTGIFSEKIRIHGITNVGGIIWWGGLRFSGIYTVQLTRLRNVRGLVPTAAELTYQWQVDQRIDNNWEDIAGETGVDYTYNRAHFQFAGSGGLRVIATDRAGLRGAITQGESIVTLGYNAAGNVEALRPAGAYTGNFNRFRWRGSASEGGTFSEISSGSSRTLATPGAINLSQKWVLASVNTSDPDGIFQFTLQTIPIAQYGLLDDAARTPLISRTSSGTNVLIGWTNRDDLKNVRGIKSLDSDISVAWKFTCKTGKTCPALSAAQQSATTLTITDSNATLYQNVSVGVVDVANTATVFSAVQEVVDKLVLQLSVSMSMAVTNGNTMVFAIATIVANANLVGLDSAAYAWERSADGISYSAISGASSKTYQIPDNYDNAFPYLRVLLTYTSTDGGAQEMIYSPYILAAPPPPPRIIQEGRTVKIDSGGFPFGAIDKSSILQYLRASTGFLAAPCVGFINSDKCRPVSSNTSQYTSGSDATTGEFILADSYFFRSALVGSFSNDSDGLGFWLGSNPAVSPLRRVVRMIVEYKIAADDATYTVESNFITLTLAADVAQVVGSGTNSRTLSISIPTSQASLLMNDNNAPVFQWQSAPAADGTYTAIASATDSVYVAPSAVTHNRFYRAVWKYEYKRGAQVAAITIMLSHAVAAQVVPVLSLSLPASGLGEAAVSLVSGGNVINTAPPAVYQWQNAATENGTFADISGATGTTYIIGSSYDNNRPYLQVALSYTHSTENLAVTAYSPVGEVAIIPQISVSMSMSQSGGNTRVFVIATITANENLVDIASAAYAWERSADGISYALISGADNQTYQIPDDYDNAFPYLRAVLSYTPVGGGATEIARSPPVLVAPPPPPIIIQEGKTVKIDSGGFPVDATEKQSILEYVQAPTNIGDIALCSPLRNSICRLAIAQYDSGTDVVDGLFILQNHYFLRQDFGSGGTAYSSTGDIAQPFLGFLQRPIVGGQTGTVHRFVRIRLTYKSALIGTAPQTVHSEFINLTLAQDVLQFVRGGDNARTLALSVVAAQASLFTAAAASSTIRWESSDTANGAYAVVDGETDTVYVAPSVAEGGNRFYRVIWRHQNTRTINTSELENITITLSVALGARFGLASLLVNVNEADGGRNSTLSVVVTGEEAFGALVSYQWQEAPNVASSNDPFVWVDIPNATTEELIFTPTSNLSRPNNRMKVEYQHSQELDLTLTIYSPVVKPFLGVASTSPTNENKAMRVDFLIQPSGTGTYQWQNAANVGGPYADISGAAAVTYTIPAAYDYSRPFVQVRYTLPSTVIISRPGVIPLQGTISQNGKIVRLQSNPLIPLINIQDSVLQYTYGTTILPNLNLCSAAVGTTDGVGCRPLSSLYSGISNPAVGLFEIPDGYFVRPQIPVSNLTIAITTFAGFGFMEGSATGNNASAPRRHVQMIVRYTAPGVAVTTTITSNLISLSLPLEDLAQLNQGGFKGKILSVNVAPTLAALLSDSHSTGRPAYVYQRSKRGNADSDYTPLVAINAQTYSVSFGTSRTDTYYRVILQYGVGPENLAITVVSRKVDHVGITISIGAQQILHAVTTANGALVAANSGVYQWQSSDSLVSNSFINIVGANAATYNFSAHDANNPYLRLRYSYTHTTVGATNIVLQPVRPPYFSPSAVIEQSDRNVSLVTDAFPPGAIGKKSVLQYLISSTNIIGGDCGGPRNSALCTPNPFSNVVQYDSGTNNAIGRFILVRGYFLRAGAAVFRIRTGVNTNSFGFWPGRENDGSTASGPLRRVVRMVVSYQIAPNGRTYNIESNFITLTVATDVAVVNGKGANGRTLAISVEAMQQTLFDPVKNNSSFQWQSAPSAEGTYTAIASADSSVYIAPSALTHNRFYQVVWQYNYIREEGTRVEQRAPITLTLSRALAAPVVPVLGLSLPLSGSGEAAVSVTDNADIISATPVTAYQWQKLRY